MPEDIKSQLDAMNEFSVSDEEVEEDESIEAVDDSSDDEEIIDLKDPVLDDADDKDDDKGNDDKDDKSDIKDEETDFDKLKKENEALRIQIEKSHEPNVVDVDVKDDTKDDKPETPEIKFLGDDIDLDELIRSPESLNAILNKVYAAGVDSYRELQEGTIKGIPEIVKSNVSMQVALSKRVNEFYNDNEDLKPFKKVVASIYEEVASENSDWDVNKVFEKVEEETRNRLELHKKAVSKDKKSKKKPEFPKAKGGKRTESKPDTNPLLDEIDAMNEF
jgi:hypothetical protein